MWFLVNLTKQTLCPETNILQNNTVNGAMSITINRVIRYVINLEYIND